MQVVNLCNRENMIISVVVFLEVVGIGPVKTNPVQCGWQRIPNSGGIINLIVVEVFAGRLSVCAKPKKVWAEITKKGVVLTKS